MCCWFSSRLEGESKGLSASATMADASPMLLLRPIENDLRTLADAARRSRHGASDVKEAAERGILKIRQLQELQVSKDVLDFVLRSGRSPPTPTYLFNNVLVYSFKFSSYYFFVFL